VCVSRKTALVCKAQRDRWDDMEAASKADAALAARMERAAREADQRAADAERKATRWQYIAAGALAAGFVGGLVITR
jgi:F0F1-type ATP synthase assembly protein I